MESRRTSLFIGSSGEALEIARAVVRELEDDIDCTIWNQDLFPAGENTLESLIRMSREFDFALMVLVPDDMRTRRDKSERVPRDNVLFELGLFMGRLDRDRTFMLWNKDDPPVLPTDLRGISGLTFRSRSDRNLRAAVGPACSRIREAVRSLGAQSLSWFDNVRDEQVRGSFEEIERDHQALALKTGFVPASNLLIDCLINYHVAEYKAALREVCYQNRLRLSSLSRMEVAIRAINNSTREICGVSIVEQDQWHSGTNYVEANIEAAHRNVEVRRIFVVTTADDLDDRDVLAMMERQTAAGIQVRWATYDKLNAFEPANIVICDNKVMTYSSKGGKHKGWVVADRDHIVQKKGQFNLMWMASTCFDGPRPVK